ncbi:MAG TPA: hypothetical protein VD994_05485, partial [Prosthecobacter sp.]|nr:hypothetical protein [Prosthecobacter sp.]
PGAFLPESRQTSHLRSLHVRLIQRAIHAFGLPILDRRRPGHPEDAHPQPIAADVQEELLRVLGERKS